MTPCISDKQGGGGNNRIKGVNAVLTEARLRGSFPLEWCVIQEQRSTMVFSLHLH